MGLILLGQLLIGAIKNEATILCFVKNNENYIYRLWCRTISLVYRQGIKEQYRVRSHTCTDIDMDCTQDVYKILPYVDKIIKKKCLQAKGKRQKYIFIHI